MKRKLSPSTISAAGLLSLCSLSTAGAQVKRAMTVDDMLNLVRIGDVVMTPDGSKVFYSERRLNWEKNKYEKTFFMVSTDGGEAVPFVRKDGGEQFRISPDGRYLAMLRTVDGRPQIFLMPLTGESHGDGRSTAERSPTTNGRETRRASSLWPKRMSEEAKKEFELGLDPIYVNEGPSGKNHGRWTHLWRIDIESKKEEQVTAEGALIDAFDVAPDGSRVVFTARKDNRGNFVFLSELYVAATDGSDTKRLTDNRALERDPVWARDGKTFVFHGNAC